MLQVIYPFAVKYCFLKFFFRFLQIESFLRTELVISSFDVNVED